MDAPDFIETVSFSTVGLAQPVRWQAVCTACYPPAGKGFGSKQDMNIWIAAHVDARHGAQP